MGDTATLGIDCEVDRCPGWRRHPWNNEKRFIRDHRLGLYDMTELSARYGISRKTGYKWLDRFDEGGRTGSATAAGRRIGARTRSPTRSRT